jgi:hypothetical protein
VTDKIQTARVRAWTQPERSRQRKRSAANQDQDKDHGKTRSVHRKPPCIAIAFDTETSIDELQNLKVGAFLACWIDSDYRFWPFYEGLFYADDLPQTDPEGFRVLKEYVRKGLKHRKYGPENVYLATLPADEPSELVGLKWYGEKPETPSEERCKELLRTRELTRYMPDVLGDDGFFKATTSGEWILRNFGDESAKQTDKEALKEIFGDSDEYDEYADALDEPDEYGETRTDPITELPIDERYGLDYWDLSFHDYAAGRLYGREYFAVTPYSSIVDPVEIELIRCEMGMPRRPDEELGLMSCSAFVNDILYEAAYPTKKWLSSNERKPATIVGANLPFDLSRIAHAVRSGVPQNKPNDPFRGGFRFTLLPGTDDDDTWTLEGVQHKSGIRIVRRAARGNMIDFASESGDPKAGSSYFTDILNLGWVLTNNTFSLESASRKYAQYPEWIKADKPDFDAGITENLITYCRRDVLSTMATYCGMMREVAKHTEYFDETRSYSPASLAKAYYRDMGLTPVLDRGTRTNRRVLGAAMSTFYGARAECHIRKTPVPVAYTDFTSMYPTVDANMQLWDFLKCERIEFRLETQEVRDLLADMTLDDLFSRAIWPDFRGMALVQPNDDLLPVRTKLGNADSTIAIAHVTSDKPMWYTIPELVAAKLLHPNRKIPEILKAYRFYPVGSSLPGLRSVRLRGATKVDPTEHDFFRLAMEQRQSIKLRIKRSGHSPDCTCDLTSNHDHVGCTCDRCSQSESLKVIANSGAYGMFAEFNVEPYNGTVRVYGIDAESKSIDTDKYDKPGEYCYPPVAALITGAARLMLAMLERSVTDAGGTWAFADTDSMAIVASPTGDPLVTDTGAIPVLTYAQVDDIQTRFDTLNPYDPRVAPGIHILKREHDDDVRQLWAYGIAAKRYALFRFRPDDSIEVLPGDGRKEHGLGAFMRPATGRNRANEYDTDTEPEKGKREHVTELWRFLIERALGRNPIEPSWFDQPVMCKVALTSWVGYQLFRSMNDGRKYSDTIKPYSFVMSPVLNDIAVKLGRDIRLMAPLRSDPADWITSKYINVNTPERGAVYEITGSREYSTAPGVTDDGMPTAPLLVKTWGDLVYQFDIHPEVKYCDSAGNTCGPHTRGLLYRHHLTIGWIDYISKESSRLTSAEKTLPDPDNQPFTYAATEDRFREVVIPVLTAAGYGGQRGGLSSIKLADELHRTGHPRAHERQLREYLSSTDLTHATRTLKENIRNPLIRLAVREAVRMMGIDIPESRWQNPASWDSECWDILITCCNWLTVQAG